MRYLGVLIVISVLQTSFAFHFSILKTRKSNRGLALVGPLGPYTQATETVSDTHQITQITSTSERDLGGVSSTEGHSMKTITPTTTTKSFSVIGTLGEMPTLTVIRPSWSSASAEVAFVSAPSTDSSTQSPIPSPTGVETNSSTLSMSHWKVAAIAIAIISVIATIILSIIFFDSWSRFLSDMLLGRKSRGGMSEELVPDWKKRSWEFKPAGKHESHRYPSFSSLGLDVEKFVEPVYKEKPGGPRFNPDPFPHRPGYAVTRPSFVTVYPGVAGYPAVSGPVISPTNAYDGIITI
jgi:hypothetical protein